MSALPQPSFPVRNYAPQSASNRSRRSKKYRPQSLSTSNQNKKVGNSSVKKISNQKSLPTQLQILLFLQKSSFGLALVLIASSIGVYISNVRIPQLWSKQYSNLETLQRQERQLIAINESLKHEIAQQAQSKNVNYTSASVENTIFIPPASITVNNDLKPLHKQDLESEINSGY